MYREKIDAFLDSKKDEMLSDLSSLVRINSQRGEAKEGMPFGEGAARALDTAEKLMKSYGFLTRNYENYVVTGDFGSQEKGLDILAHLDVVPVTQDWTVTQPFEPKVVGDRIYGRGTADDKGPAIAALYAMRAIRELELPMKKSVRLILGSDEECGSSDLKYYYGIEKEAPYSFTPDADFPVINIEKGRFAGKFAAEFDEGLQLPGVVSLKSGTTVNIVPQRASAVIAGLEEDVLRRTADEVSSQTGVTFDLEMCDNAEAADILGGFGIGSENILCWKIQVRGVSAHASTPQEGKNALTATLRLISRLPLADCAGHRVLKALDEMMPFEDTCGEKLGIYREEEQSGALTLCFSILEYSPKKMAGTFDSRLPIGCTEENTKAVVAKALAEHGITLEDTPVVNPHCVPGDSEFVKILLDSYGHYFGVEGKPLSTGGGTYVHGLKRGVAFGCMTPDVDNHMHGDDEFMEIDTLVKSAKIFADAILRICNDLD